MAFLLLLCGLVSVLFLSALFSGLETAVYGCNRVRLQTQVDAADRRAGFVLRLIRNMPPVITGLLIGNNIAAYLATFILSAYIAEFTWSAEIWTTLILTPIMFIFAESLPKRAAYIYANHLLTNSAGFLYVWTKLFYPMSVVLGSSGIFLQRFLERRGFSVSKPTGKNLLAESIEAGMADGIINQSQFDMTSKIMELENLYVGDIAFRPEEAVTVFSGEAAREAGQKILKRGYMRALLINRKGELSGKLVTLNALMRATADGNAPVSEFAVQAMRIGRMTPVLRAMNRMREQGARLAVVVDENGRFIGAIPFTRLLGYVTGRIRL